MSPEIRKLVEAEIDRLTNLRRERALHAGTLARALDRAHACIRDCDRLITVHQGELQMQSVMPTTSANEPGDFERGHTSSGPDDDDRNA